MAISKHILYTDEIYHIFNRTIAKEDAFANDSQLNRFLEIASYYKFKHQLRFSIFQRLSPRLKEEYLDTHAKFPLVEILCYAVMPNHYHFLLKQLTDNGIRIFISNLQNSYAKSFNIIEGRDGSLFSNGFKTNAITNNKELIDVSCYIHLNPVTAKIVTINKLAFSPLTSYRIYANPIIQKLISPDIIMKEFGSFKKLDTFMRSQVSAHPTGD